MIGNKNTEVPNTTWYCDFQNRNDLNQFRHLLFVRRTFEFSTIEDLTDTDQLTEAIATQDIILLQDIYRVTPLTEQPVYFRTELDFDVLTLKGKYIFRIDFLYYFDYYKKLFNFNSSDYDIMFVDINKNIIAYSPDGIKVKGAQTDIIQFEKVLIGDNQVKYLPLYIMLNDSTQLNENGVVEKLDTRIKSLEKLPVEILNVIVVSNTSMTFDVVILSSNEPLTGLTALDIILRDISNGDLTIGVLTETGPGEYSATGISPDLDYGTITVLSESYSGNGNYKFIDPVTALNLNNMYSIGGTEITFDLRKSSTNERVTGFTGSSFQLFDDILGVISFTSTEISPAIYKFTAINNVTTGTITVIEPNYSGNENYVSQILDLDITLITLRNITQVEFLATLLGAPVIGLQIADFFVTDDIEGVQIIDSFLPLVTPGKYLLTVQTGPLVSGDCGVDNVYYFGTGRYAPSTINITFTLVTEISGTELHFSAIETVSTNPAEGILASQISFVDTITGIPVVGALSEPTPGDYELTGINPQYKDGVMSVGGVYNGSTPYHLISWVSVNNGGGPETFDWIDPVNGLAKFWVLGSGLSTSTTISTGNGFTGNAQRVVANEIQEIGGLETIGGFLDSDPFPLPAGNIRIRLKYRKGGPSTSTLIIQLSNLGSPLGLITLNQSTATEFVGNILVGTASPDAVLTLFLLGVENEPIGNWYEIDVIELEY